MDQLNIYDLLFPKYKITKPIRLIEFFAGIGSQAKSIERLQKEFGFKFEHYRVIEFDKYAIASYNAVHGTDFKPSDITKIHANDLSIIDTDKYDYIMTYSFPCQDLSLAGKRRGMKKGSGTRSGLLWEVERILDECDELPQILLMENVPQVISSQNMDDFHLWQGKLEQLGYTNFVSLLNAKDYGIPQNRNRCFMISILGQYNYSFPKGFELKLRLKDMLENEVDEKYYLSNKQVKKITSLNNGKIDDNEVFDYRYDEGIRGRKEKGISPTLTTKVGSTGLSAQPLIKTDNIDVIIGSTQKNTYVGTVNDFSPTLTGSMGTGGGHVPMISRPCIEIRENTKKGYDIAQDGDGVYINRPHQKRGCVQKGMIQTLNTNKNDIGVIVDKPICVGQTSTKDSQAGKVYSEQGISPVLCAGTHGYAMGNIEHNLRIRKLTPLECWRLMGFDEEDLNRATKVNSNTQLYKQAGNSIVVDVLYYIFKEFFI